MKKLCFFSAILLSFFLFQACNNSGGKDSKQRADSINHANKPLPKDASDFMVEAAIINLNEIKLGSIAKQQATISRVRDFASMIVQDHEAANDKLQTLAQNKNVTLPDSLDEKHKSNASDLQKKKGQDFDEAFIDDMVKGHKDAIKTYQKAEKKIQDGDVRAFIENTLPELQKHLDSAQSIQDAIKGNTRNQGNATPTSPMTPTMSPNQNNLDTAGGMNQNDFNSRRNNDSD